MYPFYCLSLLVSLPHNPSQPRPVPPETTANEGLALTNQTSTTWGESLEGDTLISEQVPPTAMTVEAKQELWSDPLKFTRKSLKCLTAWATFLVEVLIRHLPWEESASLPLVFYKGNKGPLQRTPGSVESWAGLSPPCRQCGHRKQPSTQQRWSTLPGGKLLGTRSPFLFCTTCGILQFPTGLCSGVSWGLQHIPRQPHPHHQASTSVASWKALFLQPHLPSTAPKLHLSSWCLWTITIFSYHLY